MNKAAITTVLMSGLALGVGCKHHKDPAPGPAPAGASASVAEINSAKLNDATVPQAVQTAFMRDNPKAAIDTINLRTTSAGQVFYQITYISKGTPGTASYYANGAKAP
jgi:hypothetical protein